MRRLGLASLLAVLALSCVAIIVTPLSAFASPVGYAITNYDVDITVNLDNSYDIVETIDVEFTASNKHGIILERYVTASSGIPAVITNLRAEGAPYTTSHEGDYYRIKLGDPDTFAPQFVQYVISYNYFVGDQLLEDMDEFYFNLIGTDWDTSIANVSFIIRMPKPFDKERLSITAGSYGSIARTGYLAYEVRESTIVGRTVQVLMPGEGITVALPLEKGYYSEMTPRLDWGYYVAWFGLLLFPIAAIIVYAMWMKMRKNNRVVPVVEFYPPANLTSACVGYILDGVSSTREITSLLIYWAGKGYLTIEEVAQNKVFASTSTFTFTRIKGLDPATAAPYEINLFNSLFALGDGNKVTSKQLENKFHKHIEHAQHGVKAYFTHPPETRVVAQSNAPFLAIAGALAFVMSILLFFTFAPLSLYYQMGFFSFLGAGAFFSFMLVSVLTLLFKPFTDKEHASKATWAFALAMGVAVLIFVLIAVVLVYPNLIKVVSIAVGMLALSVCGWCLSTPYKRTPLGDELMGRLHGFREFLKVAEKQRIEMLLDDNPSYFFDVLPFALVLGVTDKWADKFKDIEMEPPDWYNSNTGSAFAPALFMSSMNSSLNALNTVATSTPAQSGGSGGGGSVGGGFGGGGGRSW